MFTYAKTWYYLYGVNKIKKYVIAFSSVIVVALGVWALWVSQEDPVAENPNEPKPVELKRTTDAYGDMPFESDKLKNVSDYIELAEVASSDERVFLLSDGKWIEQKIIANLVKKYEATQDGLKYLGEDHVDGWRWHEVSYRRHIDAFKQDILRDYPDKSGYIEALYELEWLVRSSTTTTEFMKDDKRKKEIEEKLKEVQSLREQ